DISVDALDGQLLAIERRVDVQALHRGRRAYPTEGSVLDRERAGGAEPASVAAQVELHRAAAIDAGRNAEGLAETHRVLEVAGKLRAEIAVEARVPLPRRG